MEPSVKTSFIPKRPIVSGVSNSDRSTTTLGFLSLITTVVVIGTIASFILVFLYQNQLVAKKTKLEVSISQARDGIGTDFVYDMNRLDMRINGVKELIKNHIVITPIFKSLEASTLRSVQYKDFSYSIKVDDSANKTQTVLVDIRGMAKNYATIALQSDAFSTNSLIKNPVFSNLTIDDKNRTVNFKLTFNVSASDLSYQTFVDSVNKKPTSIESVNSSNSVVPATPVTILEDNNANQ